MLRSMFTAINSLNLYQHYMDVVADNLSNSNTTGFKSNKVTFQDQIAQMLQVGAAPGEELGGINPVQVGLGSMLGTISGNFTQGMLQGTGRPEDLAIEGDGFFIYSDGTQQFYSRDGSLTLDGAGYLVHGGTGRRIQGWMAANGAVDTNGTLTGLQIPLGSTLAQATANATLEGNLDSSAALGADGEHVMAVGVYDSLGALHNITLTFTRTGDGAWSWAASGDGATGTGTLTFDANGQVTASGGSVTVPGANGATDTTFALDMDGLTSMATDSSVESTSQDGLQAGTLIGFNVISDSGDVMGLYSNGMKQVVGKLALANFVNPSGLVRNGQNMFTQGLNSGEAAVGAPSTGGRGAVASGYLEASNVDLAKEFTNMILAQRGFQASSRVITTSDEMMQELVNIKR